MSYHDSSTIIAGSGLTIYLIAHLDSQAIMNSSLYDELQFDDFCVGLGSCYWQLRALLRTKELLSSIYLASQADTGPLSYASFLAVSDGRSWKACKPALALVICKTMYGYECVERIIISYTSLFFERNTFWFLTRLCKSVFRSGEQCKTTVSGEGSRSVDVKEVGFLWTNWNFGVVMLRLILF